MYIQVNSMSHANTTLAIRCPHCGQRGVFISLINDLSIGGYILGQKKCPDVLCGGHVFFIKNGSSDKVIATYPSETIPFDKNNIPTNILSAFSEAIICHSNECFIASAIMIRKTLEEICSQKNAAGGNLKQRLTDLGKKIMIPRELIEAMDELRLLGNDAAHIEANTFEQVGKEEIEISIEFTKEILKATYQYEDLLGKLRSLKKSSIIDLKQ